MSEEEIKRIKESVGYNILTIASNLYTYLYFVNQNYHDLEDAFVKISELNFDDLRQIVEQFNQYNLEMSRYLCNYYASMKALVEKSMGWRNHLKTHYSIDLSADYKQELKKHQNIDLIDYFKDLRDKFVHKLSSGDAINEYTWNFTLKFGEGTPKASTQILGRKFSRDLLSDIKEFHLAQKKFTEWFIDRIIDEFMEEITMTKQMIYQVNIQFNFHPDVNKRFFSNH